MRIRSVVLLLLAAASLGGFVLIQTGAYNVAADERHWRVTERFLEWARERSIAARSRDIAVPELSADALVRTGAADYHEMCAGCHLQPGVRETELRTGLYPRPPDLARVPGIESQAHADAPEALSPQDRADAARQFWIIKHGLKMTGMPAWGLTHDDERIWAMVAFIRKLPALSPEQYQALAQRPAGEPGHDHSTHAH